MCVYVFVGFVGMVPVRVPMCTLAAGWVATGEGVEGFVGGNTK